MSKINKFLLNFALIPLIFSSTSVFALETNESQVIKAVINGENKVKAGKTIELTAKDSFLSVDSINIKYEWDFGDGTKGEGLNIAHSYKTPGFYEINLKIKNKTQSETVQKDIFVYNKQILIISDSKSLENKLSFIEEYAKNEFVYVNLIESFNSATDFISQEVLLKKFSLENEKINSSSDIIIWTQENAGINALNRHLQINPGQKENFQEKNLIIIGDINSMDKQRLSGYYKTISPSNLIITKESAIFPILDYKENLKETLINEGIEYFQIEKDTGKVKIWNIMSYGINKLIGKGIPESSIVLILLFPLIITILIFLRQIIGIIFPNVLFPALITLAFLVIGLYAGIFIVILSAITIFTTKKLLKNTGMLYTTKTGIVLILLSFQMLFLLVLNNFLELFNNDFFSIAIMPAIFLATITEQIIKPEIGFKKTIKSLLNLLIICTTIYLLLGGQVTLFSYSLQFTSIKEFTQIHPEIIPILLGFNFLIGKWTGLRLLERIRFRNLLKNLD